MGGPSWLQPGWTFPPPAAVGRAHEGAQKTPPDLIVLLRYSPSYPSRCRPSASLTYQPWSIPTRVRSIRFRPDFPGKVEGVCSKKQLLKTVIAHDCRQALLCKDSKNPRVMVYA